MSSIHTPSGDGFGSLQQTVAGFAHGVQPPGDNDTALGETERLFCFVKPFEIVIPARNLAFLHILAQADRGFEPSEPTHEGKVAAEVAPERKREFLPRGTLSVD